MNIAAKKEMLEKYADNIYRPGDELDSLDALTDEQMSDRRKEIERIFNDPEAVVN